MWPPYFNRDLGGFVDNDYFAGDMAGVIPVLYLFILILPAGVQDSND
jgi:hypothetical protein